MLPGAIAVPSFLSSSCPLPLERLLDAFLATLHQLALCVRSSCSSATSHFCLRRFAPPRETLVLATPLPQAPLSPGAQSRPPSSPSRGASPPAPPSYLHVHMCVRPLPPSFISSVLSSSLAQSRISSAFSAKWSLARSSPVPILNVTFILVPDPFVINSTVPWPSTCGPHHSKPVLRCPPSSQVPPPDSYRGSLINRFLLLIFLPVGNRWNRHENAETKNAENGGFVKVMLDPQESLGKAQTCEIIFCFLMF